MQRDEAASTESDHSRTSSTQSKASKAEEATKRPGTGSKFVDFLLSIFGGGEGSKVKSHSGMAIMGGEGPGTNLVFYDRKLEDIWKKRKEQESARERERNTPCFASSVPPSLPSLLP